MKVGADIGQRLVHDDRESAGVSEMGRVRFSSLYEEGAVVEGVMEEGKLGLILTCSAGTVLSEGEGDLVCRVLR